jgi:hypothetical protein
VTLINYITKGCSSRVATDELGYRPGKKPTGLRNLTLEDKKMRERPLEEDRKDTAEGM